MRTANDNAMISLPAWAVPIAMRHYVRIIEDTCAQSGLDPEDFLRVFCGELGARGFHDLANVEQALNFLQARSTKGRLRLVSPDETANVE